MKREIENFIDARARKNFPPFQKARILDTSIFPRKIYAYWDQGFENAPEICRYCLTSWKTHNPDWEIVALDKNAAPELMPKVTLPTNIAESHYADILRTHILAEHGGVWVDADLLCRQPLDQWLLNFLSHAPLFTFSPDGRERVISNWFLAASPQSQIFNAWRDICVMIWDQRPNADLPYFWHMSSFEYLIRHDLDAKTEFDQMPKFGAQLPLYLRHHLHEGTLDDKKLQALRNSPVHKLNHRKDIYSSDIIQDLFEELDKMFTQEGL